MRAKFARKLSQKNLSAAEIVDRYREIAEIVEAAPIEEASLRDPDDAAVLACALAARAEAIVSGDSDLHALGNYQGIPILTAAECLRRVSGKANFMSDTSEAFRAVGHLVADAPAREGLIGGCWVPAFARTTG